MGPSTSHPSVFDNANNHAKHTDKDSNRFFVC